MSQEDKQSLSQTEDASNEIQSQSYNPDQAIQDEALHKELDSPEEINEVKEDLDVNEIPEDFNGEMSSVNSDEAVSDQLPENVASDELDLPASSPAESPGGSETQDLTPTAKPKRIGLWKRIVNWFRRKPYEKIEEPELPSENSAAPATLEDLNSALAEIAELRKQIAAKTSSAESLERQIACLDTEARKLDDWLESTRRSFFSKFERQMGEHQTKARADMAEYEKLVSSMKLPEQGRLAELRRKFHKYLAVTFITFAIPIFLMFFITWASRINLVTWLSDIVSSPLYLVILATMAALVAGVLIVLRRVLGKKIVTGRKSFRLLYWIVLIPLVFYGLFYFQRLIRQYITPLIEDIRPTAIWVSAILFTFTLLAGLIIYYSDWSVFRRQVTEELSGLDNVVTGYVKTKQELARLDFLYEQTRVWLKLLAHTIYRPWKIHPDWKSENVAQKSSESFPMALRVAQAAEDDIAESAQLRRAIASRLLVQGWRSDAFEKSVSQIGQYLGYDAQKVSIELLESDLPHQPNNSRKLVLDFFEHSAETAALGTLDLGSAPNPGSNPASKVPPSDYYLVEVARTHMAYLIEKTQGLALSEARPSVQHVVLNPLADLLQPGEDSESLQTAGWHEFLASGLGIEEPIQPPLGLLAFTDEGMKARSADPANSKTKILIPERAASAIPKPKASNIELVSLPDDEESHPAEIIVRLDVSGPLPFRHVSLIQNSQSVSVHQAALESQDDL
jgi:ribosomal protein S15P/S13E